MASSSSLTMLLYDRTIAPSPRASALVVWLAVCAWMMLLRAVMTRVWAPILVAQVAMTVMLSSMTTVQVVMMVVRSSLTTTRYGVLVMQGSMPVMRSWLSAVRGCIPSVQVHVLLLHAAHPLVQGGLRSGSFVLRAGWCTGAKPQDPVLSSTVVGPGGDPLLDAVLRECGSVGWRTLA